MEVKRKSKNVTKIVQINKPLQPQIVTLLVFEIFHNFTAGQKSNALDVGSIIIIYLHCKWVLTRWQLYYSRPNTQMTHITLQTKHSTQNYTSNKGH
jgi:hypothetical protein